MRISDWSSDVCSSDLFGLERGGVDAAIVGAFDQRLDAVVVQARHDDRRSRGFGCCHDELQGGRGRRAERASSADQVRWFERTEEHTYELQSLMRRSYAVYCLK